MLRSYHGYVSVPCESASYEDGDGRNNVSCARARPILQTGLQRLYCEFAGRKARKVTFTSFSMVSRTLYKAIERI